MWKERFSHCEGKFSFYRSASEELGTTKKKIAKLFGEEFWVEKNDPEFMRIFGDFAEHNYLMEVVGVSVAIVDKKWVSVRDQLGVSITGEIGVNNGGNRSSCY